MMRTEKPATLTSSSIADTQFFLLGSEGLVFCQASKQLHHLNTSATYIWCGLEEGLEVPQIVRSLAGQFQIPMAQASRDVREALTNWASRGFAPRPSATASGTVAHTRRYTASPSSTSVPSAASKFPVNNGPRRNPAVRRAAADRGVGVGSSAPRPSASHEQHYCIGELDFRLRFGSADARSKVHTALAHLATQAGTAGKEVPVSIDIVEDAGLFQLIADDIKHPTLVTGSEIVPLVYQLILTRAYQSSNCLAAFHAGAVSNDMGCILLPGAPGSGKSTLIAALVGSGLSYLTDELVLLMPDESLCPLPVGLGLKRGSWPLLAPEISALAHLPIHRQADGTEVRYLTYPSVLSQVDCPPLRALVFPQYVAEAQTMLSPLSTAQSLYRITVAGYAVPGELDSRIVASLIDWISAQACYELQVGDLNSAVSLAHELLA